MALIPSLAFTVCLAAGQGGSRDEPSPVVGTKTKALCTNVALLDDRYPIIVYTGKLSEMTSDLLRLQELRKREDSLCVRLALGVNEAPATLLKPLQAIALSNPQLLLGVAIVPLSGEPAAPVLLWHLGYEERFQTLDAATVAARAYVP